VTAPVVQWTLSGLGVYVPVERLVAVTPATASGHKRNLILADDRGVARLLGARLSTPSA
jgi:hypothetical protein